MSHTFRPLLALALVCSLAACQKEATPPAAPTATPAAAPTAPAATTAPVAAPVATADSVGVVECDDYLKKYEACVASKVPDGVKATLQQSLAQTRAAWKAAAATDAGKQGLAVACKSAYDGSKAMMQQYGCSDF
jgi:curli biogenesis system outer membrane secretion channel CsgG